MSKTTKPKQPKITYKQEGGDDGYCYVVRVNGRIEQEGLTRSEAMHTNQRMLKQWKEEQEKIAKLDAEFPPVTSMRDLYVKSKTDERYQKLTIVTLQNYGCEHLASRFRGEAKWDGYYSGLQQYWQALVGEYGMGEAEAEREIVEQINDLRDCIDHANLEWETPAPKGGKKVVRGS